MGRLLLVGSVAGAAALLLSADARRQTAEALRELSERLLLGTLRASSGFAAHVPAHLEEEERERRLRWR